jgi:shikimate dehydrogenase
MPAEPSRRRAAVLGHPIEHSLSPVLHRAAYAELGLDWEYDRIDMTGDQLAGFLDGLDGSWAGLSLTMPLKLDVLALLHEVDPVAASTRSVNTVVLRAGRRVGHNTDVAGIVSSVRGATAAGALPGRPSATVLGAGATARSAIAALAEMGVSTVSVLARRPDAADDLRAAAHAVGVLVEVRSWDDAGDGLLSDIVVSTVPAGAADSLADRVPSHPGRLLDVVYHPWPTALATAWAAHGGAVASGLDLLLHQAVRQVELMTGLRPSVEVLRAALDEAARTR